MLISVVGLFIYHIYVAIYDVVDRLQKKRPCDPGEDQIIGDQDDGDC